MPVRVVATVEQKDHEFTGEQLGLTMESTDQQVLDAARGVLGEVLRDQAGAYTYGVRRGINQETGQETLYVYPKGGLGSIN